MATALPIGLALGLTLAHHRLCPDLRGAPSTATLPPVRTGDLLVTQHDIDALVRGPVLYNYPTHVAMVWVHPRYGALALEATSNTAADDMDNVLADGRVGVGIRAVRLPEFLAKYRGRVFWRALRGPPVDARAAVEAVYALAAGRKFERRVASTEMWSEVGLSFSPLCPPLAQALVTVSGLDLVDARVGVFCCELVVHVLRAVGVLPSRVPQHAWAPLCFTSGARTMDAFAAECGYGWAEEVRLLAGET
jgi:hypothetical protein